MAGLSISRAWDETKQVIARDGNLILSVALALIILPQLIVGLIDPSTDMTRDPSLAAGLLELAAGMIGIVGQLALIRLALGPTISVGEAISHGARRFLPALGALILFGIGFALLLVPILVLLIATGTIEVSAEGAPSAGFGGLLTFVVIVIIALIARVILLMPVASAEAKGPIAILRRSWALSSGHYWRLLAFVLLILIVAIMLLLVAQLIGGVIAGITAGGVEPLSLSALIVSLLVAAAQGIFSVLSSVMLARIYAELAGGDVEVSVPSSGN